MQGTLRRHRLRAAATIAVVASGVVLCLAPPAGAVPVPWQNCGRAGDVINVTKFEASVWPPQAGKPITVDFQFTVATALGWSTRVSTSITDPAGRTYPLDWIFPLLPPLRLPLAAGPHTVQETFVPAWDLEPGAYQLHLSARTISGAEALCMNLTIPLKGRSGPT
jgi:hypothetical protein